MVVNIIFQDLEMACGSGKEDTQKESKESIPHWLYGILGIYDIYIVNRNFSGKRKLNKVIIFITHDINEAFFLGERVAIMKEGKLQQIGKPTEILKNPATEYIKEFIRDVNKMQVLYCRDIMQSEGENFSKRDNLPSLRTDQTLEEVLKVLGECTERTVVVDENGIPCGQIQRDDIIKAIVHGL